MKITINSITSRNITALNERLKNSAHLTIRSPRGSMLKNFCELVCTTHSRFQRCKQNVSLLTSLMPSSRPRLLACLRPGSGTLRPFLLLSSTRGFLGVTGSFSSGSECTSGQWYVCLLLEEGLVIRCRRWSNISGRGTISAGTSLGTRLGPLSRAD